MSIGNGLTPAQQQQQFISQQHRSQALQPPVRHTWAGFKHGFWRGAKIGSLICLAVFILAVVRSQQTPVFASSGPYGATNGAHDFWSQVEFWSLGIFLFFWLTVWFFGFLGAFHQNAKAAVAPIPSVQEIDHQLRLEGYDPSLQDVLAVEARLKSERNQAAVVSVALIVGAHLGARQAAGKPLL